MKFLEIVNRLQLKNNGYIVIIKNGIFFIGVGKDAILLNKILGLKLICMKTGLCKAGFVVKSIDKYIHLLSFVGKSFVVYQYNRKSNLEDVEEVFRYNGEKIYESRCALDCKDCPNRQESEEEYIMWLYEKLKNMTYKHGGYTTFYISKSKVRRIEKSRYTDRIVHRWVVDNFLIPYFVPTFVNTSYACLKNKGMHKACLEVQKAMLHCKRIWGEYYILKMDVRKYFENINKNILFEILSRKIKDKKLMWLMKEIIYSNEGDKGLPIGNYTSQMFANIYLNEVDQYIKHRLHCKWYFRYMDDSIILLQTKQEAKEVLQRIQIFLKEKLELELNNKTQIFKSKQGVNFCGYKINEYRLKIRDKRKKKIKEKSKRIKI